MVTSARAITYADKPWVNNYDDGVPSTLTYPDQPLHTFLTETAKRVPNRTALVTNAKVPLFGRLSNEMTYAELERASNAMAAALVDMGLKKGDRVAIVMPNTAAFVISFYAIFKAGGVVAATNPTYPPGKMAYQINDCDAEFAITLSLFYNTIKEIQSQTKLKKVIVANVKQYLPPIAKILFTIAREKKDGHYLESLKSGDVWFQDLLKKYDGQSSNVTVTPEDTALFQYTGGTTGVSKAAVSQHKALVANMLQLSKIVGVYGVPGEEEIYLGAIPFFHVYGLVVVVSLSVYSGSKIILVPNARDIDDVIDCIEHYKPTLFPGVPALYNAINNHPRAKAGEVDLSSLRFCISGSAPLPPVTQEEFERISGSSVREGFGMSEAPTATHVNPIFKENRIGSIGLPLPDMEMRIVSLDDGVSEVPVGEIGELLMYGPNLMTGYHRMPTETSNALREKDGKRWLYTGDIARMDEDGYFYIVDRKKDMALIGGFNVYPNAVEQAIKEHPDVIEVGVAAIPHPQKRGQEALKAWIVKSPDSDLTEQDMIAFLENKLAQYEIPRRISFIDELPKSTVGKTLRRELIRMEEMDSQ
ncbi:AMP-binding protein [Phototrophicus methaneseepsis]|uniref:AMP-binding protein n=1 Tax=Phototrophicus methaneseepsis TaxID=2710758 RepID=A0A7S8IDM2_9CHLR|nr:AMP-binding protein [Phototrophicus methaneseepsis]QPC80953.1 AMP-binding protein [Phototrophicus methaneseepsis]